MARVPAGRRAFFWSRTGLDGAEQTSETSYRITVPLLLRGRSAPSQRETENCTHTEENWEEKIRSSKNSVDRRNDGGAVREIIWTFLFSRLCFWVFGKRSRVARRDHMYASLSGSTVRS